MSHAAVKAKTLIPATPVELARQAIPKPTAGNGWRFKLDAATRRALRAAEATLITEDDEPVDNPFSEKQQALLVRTLYSSWTPPPGKGRKKPRSFWAAANVGIFDPWHKAGIAPDLFVSLDAAAPKNWRRNKAYFFWEYDKFPELVLEIVSNTRGGEISKKNNRYAEMGIPYYVVFDPDRYLKGELLRVFVWREGVYQPQREAYFPVLGLGLTLWQGSFENKEDLFLRWCDRRGKLLPTADERAVHEAERAAHEAERAAHEAERAAHEAGRAAKLAAKLRELGIDPEGL